MQCNFWLTSIYTFFITFKIVVFSPFFINVVSFDVISISRGFNLCFTPYPYALLPTFVILLSLYKSQTTKISCTAVVYSLLFSKQILVLFHYILATIALLLFYLKSNCVLFIFLRVADHLCKVTWYFHPGLKVLWRHFSGW